MSTKFHQIKRFALILAGTAALSGAVVPMAMADAPSGSGWADPGDCQSFHDTYDYYINGAADAIASGNLTAAFVMAEDAAANKSAAEDAGCNTSTWASGGSSGSIAPVAVNRVSVASVTVAQP